MVTHLTPGEIIKRLRFLTNLELNLVEHLMSTKTYREIGEELGGVSQFTIRNTAGRIYHKFGILTSSGVNARLEFCLSMLTYNDLAPVRERIAEARRLEEIPA